MRGEWTDIQLLAAEIYSGQTPSTASPKVLELLETGIEAMRVGDFELAETSFEEAVEAEPDSPSAVYNLCTVWLRRDGIAGQRKARARLEQLHQDAPDYQFAIIALAQFAAMDGEFQRARDLLAPLLQAERLHIAEVIALFTTQVQIALKEGDLDAAERTFKLLCEICDEGHPEIEILRSRIDKAKRKGGWRGLFSKFR